MNNDYCYNAFRFWKLLIFSKQHVESNNKTIRIALWRNLNGGRNSYGHFWTEHTLKKLKQKVTEYHERI